MHKSHSSWEGLRTKRGSLRCNRAGAATVLAKEKKPLAPIPSDHVVQRIARALNHPMRIQILEQLAVDGTGSASSLSKRLDAPLGTVSYHFRVLHEECTVLKRVGTRRVRGATETFYRLATPRIRRPDWSRLPSALLTGLEGALLTSFVDALIAALKSGSLVDKTASTLVYLPITLDAQGLDDSNRAMREAVEITKVVAKESQSRLQRGGGEAIRTIVGGAVFEAASYPEEGAS
jgi:DNA-binding transcriptional ArsR family regulator